MKKLKVGLIGCGGIARACHIPAWLAIKDAEVVAVCDINVPKAEKFAEEFGVGKVFEKYTDLMELEGLDAVDICTPNYLHSPIAVAALEHGLNVFCEKPDSVCVADVEKMRDAAEKSGKLLMVMRNNRYMPSSLTLKKMIENGELGDIYCARCGWQRRRGIPGKGGWFTTKAQSGGGPLIDLGVHMIDLAVWLMGSPRPVSVSGCTYNKFAGTSVSDSVNSSFGEAKDDGTFDVEDLAMGFIRFENGCCMQIEFSWASNIDREKRYVELRGTKAGSSWSDIDDTLRIFTEKDGKLEDICPEVPDAAWPIGRDHGANIKHFTECLLHGAKPMFVPQQGIDMVKILTAIYESAETGREVIL